MASRKVSETRRNFIKGAALASGGALASKLPLNSFCFSEVEAAPTDSTSAMEVNLFDLPMLYEKEVFTFDPLGQEVKSVLGDGWREEHSGLLVTLIKGLCATSIEVQMNISVLRPRDLSLNLSMFPHCIDSVTTQVVRVYWNDLFIGECVFLEKDGWGIRNFKFDVPHSAQVQGKNLLSFHSRFALSAKDVGRGGEKADARRIAFGILSFEIQDSSGKVASVEDYKRDGAALLQPAGTMLRIPYKIADTPSKQTLKLMGPPNDANAKIYLQVDTLDGMEQIPLAISDKEFDLTPWAGHYAELILDTTQSESGKTIQWPDIKYTASEVVKDVPVFPPAGIPETRAKNMVVICMDALTLAALGANGAKRASSPFMDTLAHNAITFEACYTHATWTLPSVSSFLTGLYPHQHKVHYVNDKLPDEAPLFTDSLRKGAVHTACFAENPFFDSRYGFKRAFDEYEYIFPTQSKGEVKGSETVTAKAVDFLGKNKGNPFFLYLHYFAPHAPYSQGNSHKQTLSFDPVEIIPPLDDAMHSAELGRTPRTPEGIKQLQCRYYENVRYADDQIAKVFQSLKENAYGEDTVVILMADHGEAFGQHGFLGHSDDPYEMLIRTPLLLVKGPEPTASPQRLGAIRNVDLSGLILKCFGMESIVKANSEALIDNFAQSQNIDPVEAFMLSQYKLLVDTAGPVYELYDLKRDPEEKSNMSVFRPALAHYIEARARQWKKTLLDTATFGGASVQIDKESTENLKSLGYL